jgi:hypothetical protein
MVHQLFIDFKKAYDSVKRELLYNIQLEFGIPKKLVKLIKMCLNETYSKVSVGKFLSDNIPCSEWPETRCSIAIALEFCIRICHQESPENQVGLEFNGTYQVLVYADINLLGSSINKETLLEVSRDIGL